MFGGQMHGYWGAGWLIGFVLLVIFLVGFVFFVVWVVRQIQKNTSEAQYSQPASTPKNILKERYAMGEISRDEYLSMLEDLKG